MGATPVKPLSVQPHHAVDHLSLSLPQCVCVPAPEADPLLFTGHPLTYSVPYVTYHKTECNTEVEEVKGQECVTKPVTKCNDIEAPSHRIKVDNVCQNVTTAGCTEAAHFLKREADAEADPQLIVGAGVIPYHTCTNVVQEVCYPVQTVEETTITEQACLLRAEVECKEVVVAKIPRVICNAVAPEAAEAGEGVDCGGGVRSCLRDREPWRQDTSPGLWPQTTISRDF